MKPPNCYLCERGLDTKDECDLVYFTEIPSNVINSISEYVDQIPTHPDNSEWFCLEKHFDLAKQFMHLKYEEAIECLKSITKSG